MSGRLRLAATGVQDQWLTGDPQFSYFLMNFRRHTKFAIDYVESQFDGDIDFGKTIISRVPNDKGDLVSNMTIKVTLDDPVPNDDNWSPSIISHLVESAELLIGGQTVEKITGEYIYMHQQLHNTDDDINQTLYFLNGHSNVLTYTAGTEYTYFMDLPFYFYRNPSLAIPTCALTKQLVEVKIKLRSLPELINGGASAGVTANIKKFSLDNEFVFLTDNERNFMMSRPLDYIITQVQMSKFVMNAGENTKSVMLNFSHPVRELFFVSQSEEAVRDNHPHRYNTISNIKLQFNNTIVFDRDNDFLVYEQAFKHHVNSPYNYSASYNYLKSDFAMYSFALQPEVYYPTGQVNMSRIAHKLLTIEIDPINSVDNNNTRIYAVNYNLLRVSGGLAGLKF
ncbi:hypothetical protein OlV7_089 [Ostreococcus lucimarinus virus 7]|jgi:hypothetical protein|uniref:hypothetical protein n=1 Tax=Ostreococcus lucimarinus virus 7 TaxID=1663209 RepID=UPI0006D05F67|nr:hypothetical protein AP054_gp089 [Ostreococcus lucimarinus virus 7]ALI95721.1 hypothetical protein OlV7_089 [Ostreococcus lucimarinus virus 7]QBP06782.1 hypothetical protein OlV7_gene88 [Ostreococcus lucimarinus virus 7]